MLLGDLIYRVGADIKGFDTEMAKVSKSLLKMDRESQKALAGFDRMGQRIADVGQTLTIGLTVPIAGVAAASLKMAGDFEGAMNRVSALGDITGSDLAKLQAQAMKLGADTQFSALQAAQGMGELAAAGHNTTQIMAEMPGVLQLAAAGQMSIAESATIVKDVLGQFQMTATESGKAVDILAEASMAGSATMAEMGTTLSYVGPVAHGAGQSLTETVASIVALDQAGIRGEKAGTGLRGVLGSLLSPSDKAAAAMEQLGIKISDSSGKMLPLSDIMEQFRSKLQNVHSETERQALIFQVFGREAGNAAQILIQTGGPALDAIQKKLDESGGAADRVAKTLNQGLSYSLEQLKGSIETAGIALGQVLIPIANQALAAFTNFINTAILPAIQWFKELPPSVQNVALGFTALVAAVGPMLFIGGQLAQSLVSLHGGFGLLIKALPTLSTTVIPAVTSAFSSLVGILASPVGLIALLGAGIAGAAYVAVKSFTEIETATDRMNKKAAEDAKVKDKDLQNEADRLFKVRDAVIELEKTLKAKGQTVSQGNRTLDEYLKYLQGLSAELPKTKNATAEATEEVKAFAEWNRKVAESFDGYGDGAVAIYDAANDIAALNRVMGEQVPIITGMGREWGKLPSLIEATLPGVESLSVAMMDLGRAPLPALEQSWKKTLDGISGQFDRNKEHASEWSRQVSTIVTDFGRQTADLFIGLFKGDSHNEELRKQEAELRASLAQREQEWSDYQVEVASEIEKITAENAASMAEQIADLQAGLADKEREYQDYARDIADQIDEVTEKHREAADREAQQARDSLQSQIDAYNDYVDQATKRLDELDEREGRSAQDDATRIARANEDYSDDLDDRKRQLQRNLADKKKDYDRDTAALQAKLNAELAKGKAANQQSIADYRRQLQEKADDYNEYVQRQTEDFNDWVEEHEKALNRQLADIDTAAQRRKEDLSEQKSELQEGVDARTAALDQAKADTAAKLAEIQTSHAAETAAEVADLTAKLGDKKAALDQYTLDAAQKAEDVRAAMASKLDAEVADLKQKLTDKKQALEDWKVNELEPKLQEIQDSFTTVWDKIGGAFGGMLTGAAEAIARFGTEALVGKLFKWLTGEGGLLSQLGSVGSAIAGIFGGGGGAAASAAGQAAGGAASAAGAAAQAGGAAASGASAGLSLASAGISAAGGVAGGLITGFMLTGDLGKIEENTRGTKDQLVLGLQPQINKYLPILESIGGATGPLWLTRDALVYDIQDRLKEIRDAMTLKTATVPTALDDIKTGAESGFKSIVDAIKDVFAGTLKVRVTNVSDFSTVLRSQAVPGV